MRLIRKGKKTSYYEVNFLHPFVNYIIPQDFGFNPSTITYQIIETSPTRVNFNLMFTHEKDYYTLECTYYIIESKMAYRYSVQCGM